MSEQEEKHSGHRAEVVPISLIKHPNADRLSIVELFGGGYTCVSETTQWEGKDRAAWIPPDTLVNTSRDEFAFLIKDAKLDGFARIKAKKLRGVNSYGLLVPCPPDAEIGSDLFDYYGCKHYEMPIKGAGGASHNLICGDNCAGPTIMTPGKYDVENMGRYKNLFNEGETVWVNEKPIFNDRWSRA